MFVLSQSNHIRLKPEQVNHGSQLNMSEIRAISMSPNMSKLVTQQNQDMSKVRAIYLCRHIYMSKAKIIRTLLGLRFLRHLSLVVGTWRLQSFASLNYAVTNRDLQVLIHIELDSNYTSVKQTKQKPSISLKTFRYHCLASYSMEHMLPYRCPLRILWTIN